MLGWRRHVVFGACDRGGGMWQSACVLVIWRAAGWRRHGPSACATSYSYVLRSYILLVIAERQHGGGMWPPVAASSDQLAFLLLLVGIIRHRQIHGATGFFPNFFFVSKMQLLR